MRVTIVPEDQTVIVDGDTVLLPDALTIDPNTHAIQWYGDYGVIEYKIGPAVRFTDQSVIQPHLDQRAAYVAQMATEKAAADGAAQLIP